MRNSGVSDGQEWGGAHGEAPTGAHMAEGSGEGMTRYRPPYCGSSAEDVHGSFY